MTDKNFLEDEDGEISLNALKGCSTNKIIKVGGKARSRKLMVLIDGGSTYSFLDENTAKDLHCKLKSTFLLSVAVANGSKMHSKSKCVLIFVGRCKDKNLLLICNY